MQPRRGDGGAEMVVDTTEGEGAETAVDPTVGDDADIPEDTAADYRESDDFHEPDFGEEAEEEVGAGGEAASGSGLIQAVEPTVPPPMRRSPPCVCQLHLGLVQSQAALKGVQHCATSIVVLSIAMSFAQGSSSASSTPHGRRGRRPPAACVERASGPFQDSPLPQQHCGACARGLR